MIARREILGVLFVTGLLGLSARRCAPSGRRIALSFSTVTGQQMGRSIAELTVKSLLLGTSTSAAPTR